MGTVNRDRRTSGLTAQAESLRQELVDLRRTIHRNPELGFEESGTNAVVRQFIEQRVPRARFDNIARTGLLVSLPGDGPQVLLRACLDALPIQDTKDVEYASQNPGKGHACGHDGQVARLAGALVLLGAEQHAAGIHALFQPAEEIDEGAQAVLDEGLLEDIRPHIAFGFHGHPALNNGSVGVKSGPLMASITTVRCRVIGREGHAAEPHQSVDAGTAAASLIIDWQTALARRVDPRHSIVLTIGKISSGVAPNVVPGEAELEGTLRVLDPSCYDHVLAILREVARGVESKLGVSTELDFDFVVPAIVNHPEANVLVREATEAVLGADAPVEAAASLGGDDFARFLDRVPGAYFFIGEAVKDREKYGWHDPAYDLDEDSLVSGSAVLAELITAVERKMS